MIDIMIQIYVFKYIDIYRTYAVMAFGGTL